MAEKQKKHIIGKKKSSTTPKNRRQGKEYAALDKMYNLRTRTDLIDYDYLHKLSAEDKEWLNKFTEEYTNASFSEKNKDNIQKEPEHKTDAYNRNNARNRCILTRQKANASLNYLEDMVEKGSSPEDLMATQLDLRAKGFLDKNNKIVKVIKDGKIVRKR